jgi:hypothetical protein
MIRHEAGPGTAVDGAENDGGSLAGNDSSDASSTLFDKSAELTRSRRACGRNLTATHAPVASAKSPHIMFFDTTIKLVPFRQR